MLFVPGCNFNCPYCHNPDLAKGSLQPDQAITEGEVFSFLQARKGFLDGVVISGGEPTLMTELLKLCERIKQAGFWVKLDTNGSRPDAIRQLIQERLVDYIAMDIKTDPADYPRWMGCDSRPEEIVSSIRLIRSASVSHEFRTTCIRPFIEAAVVDRIARMIEGAPLYALQRFAGHRLLRPQFVKNRCTPFSDAELSRFQSIAEPWVESCIVR